MIKNKRKAGSSAILRVVLENYVHPVNMNSEKNYHMRYRSNYHREWIRLLEGEPKDNPFLKDVRTYDKFHEALGIHKEQLAQLKREGEGPVSIREAFEKAGLLDAYRSIYNF